ncbi:MAG TPA: virulence factor SrfB [Opitutaceae bacterium]
MPVQLNIFPNTGHQFFSVALKQLLPKRDDGWLAQFAQANRTIWQPWDSYTPWIRYQYAIEDDTPVLKLAIETNLGLPSRGLLFDLDEKIYDQRPDEQQQLSPYASTDEAQIESDYGAHRLMPLSYLPNNDGKHIDVELAIHWMRPDGRDPIDVDLVVDLGNSRTIALLLESPGRDSGSAAAFGRRIRIVRFVPRATPYDYGTGVGSGSVLEDSCAIIDSWLLLHRPLFARNDPPLSFEKIFDSWEGFYSAEQGKQLYRRKRYLPHVFVELAPALIGGGRSPEGAAKILASVSLDRDARFFLSSPKRYVWDERPVGQNGRTVWKQIPNPTDDPLPPDFFDDLSGLVRYFMDPGGVDWDIDHPPTEDDFRGMPFPHTRPTFPRRDAVCWFGIAILETAYRQINSPEYRRSTGRDSLPRRLRHVRVTYPSGWTDEERTKYLAQWQRAIDLFTLTRFPDHRPVSLIPGQKGGQRPILAPAALDEAVCSQLPILYSDIHALAGNGQQWFQLFGASDRAVVMNIDIGGGTTDLSVIEYRLGKRHAAGHERSVGSEKGVTLQPRLLLRHGTRIAGDLLVKKIIERVITPAWVRAAGSDVFSGNPEAREWLTRLFKNPAHNEFASVDPHASQKLARIMRLVFVPLANELLERLGRGRDLAWEPLALSDHADPTIVGDLNALVNNAIRKKTRRGAAWRRTVFPFEGVALKCDRVAVEACIDDVFGDMFDSLSSLVGEFGCHLVIVSGKPSELPRVRELIVESFPLLPQRIVEVKNFPAGSWYPFSSFDGGRILDAKTCTVVGATLYQDLCNGVLEGFALADEGELGLSRQFYWGILTRSGMPEELYDRKNLLFSPRDYPGATPEAKMITLEKEFPLFPLNCRIGRQIARMTDIRPDPVYELAWEPKLALPLKGAHARVKLRWVSERGKGERLELVSVASVRGEPEVDPAEVHLRLNTMFEESFWLDEPRLEIDVPA